MEEIKINCIWASQPLEVLKYCTGEHLACNKSNIWCFLLRTGIGWKAKYSTPYYISCSTCSFYMFCMFLLHALHVPLACSICTFCMFSMSKVHVLHVPFTCSTCWKYVFIMFKVRVQHIQNTCSTCTFCLFGMLFYIRDISLRRSTRKAPRNLPTCHITNSVHWYNAYRST